MSGEKPIPAFLSGWDEECINKLDIAETRRVFVGSDKFETPQEAENYQAVWNVSRNKLACISSDKYNVVQHRDLVGSAFESLNNLNIAFTHRIRQDRHRIFVDIDFPAFVLKPKVGEDFKAGIRIVNSYDKSTGVMIFPRLTRLACSNGMVVSRIIAGGYHISHTQKLATEFSRLIDLVIKEMVNSVPALKTWIDACIADSVEMKIVNKILPKLFEREKHLTGVMSKLKVTSGKVTRWELYNAITDYATHGEQLKPNVENWLQSKAQQVLTTPLEKFLEVRI